ncbi:MAG TPA: 2-oxoglutarate dehydrogenase E1 component, partial [Terriglobia bacterium]|nr:2-oxoglutarate dehydrogenase E1 component [Terriglobia bacterium]
MNDWREFRGPNAGYVAELYERYRRDPNSVDPATRRAFEHSPPPPSGLTRAEAEAGGATAATLPGVHDVHKVVGAVNLAESIRKFGHLDARLDPLGSEPPSDPSLSLAFHQLTEDDLRRLPASIIVGTIADGKSNALEVIQELRQVYSSVTGYDYAHLRDPEERDWLRVAAESGLFRPPADPIDEIALLERLTQEGAFEQFLHRTFPGKTRFSIEGLGILIPALDEVIGRAAEAEFHDVLIGMAHRARLNVLAHVLKKPYAQILAEFKDPVRASRSRHDLGWTGDVKYHLGARRTVKGASEVELVVSIAPNPSHLEAVNPVVEGMARAAGTRVEARGAPHFDPAQTLPILIHGDAAFPGQGVVAETLNLYRLPGYSTGGTIHIIANNQLGFTTAPEDSRSTLYSSDLARGFRIPIVHVNADHPEACLEAARLALAYRVMFQKDFVIDLVGYRRYGHNEGDEPSFTQPVMYRKIQSHPTVRQLWTKTLLDRGVIEVDLADKLVRKHIDRLESVLTGLEPEQQLAEAVPEGPPPGAARQTRTALPADRLRELNQSLLAVPEGFNVNRKLERARERRRRALDSLDERTIDWAMAEELALASILADGTAIRLTGQDAARGTFSQRHAVFYDAKSNAPFIPLQALPQARAAFEVHNSPLSENACLGFEYGYNVQAPERLTIWEAQYGDFINGAQTVVDEFVVSARAKWGLTPSLVLLLPHGLEGQGPDHASARPERFLELAAASNLRLANCTTAAQYFHLLRLQAALLQVDPLPLVVFTPKSLLRHPLVASSLRELAEGRFERVIDDARPGVRAEARRLILCAGKVYVDLVSSEAGRTSREVALCRVEQLYPFAEHDLRPVFDHYPHLEEVVWLQEEPRNMGWWPFMRRRIPQLIEGRWPFHYIGR